MGAPQIVLIVMIAVEMGGALSKRGQPKTGAYTFTPYVIWYGAIAYVLWWGGFWNAGQ